jgi:hypothetical protein
MHWSQSQKGVEQLAVVIYKVSPVIIIYFGFDSDNKIFSHHNVKYKSDSKPRKGKKHVPEPNVFKKPPHAV